MLAPFLDEMCDPRDFTKTDQRVNFREAKSLNENKNDIDEATGNSTPPPQIPATDAIMPLQNNGGDGKKFVRPRFASTELGIREKLFIAVLTTPSTFNSYALAVNKTSAHYVTKMMYFTTSKPNNPSAGMSVITFPDKDSRNLPIHVLKYIAEHYATTFDYYMFITDRTYIRAEKIYELVSHISISQDVHMGAPSLVGQDTNVCSLEGGVILSQVK